MDVQDEAHETQNAPDWRAPDLRSAQGLNCFRGSLSERAFRSTDVASPSVRCRQIGSDAKKIGVRSNHDPTLFFAINGFSSFDRSRPNFAPGPLRQISHRVTARKSQHFGQTWRTGTMSPKRDALSSRRNGSFRWLRLAAGEKRKLAATIGAVWRPLLRRAGQS